MSLPVSMQPSKGDPLKEGREAANNLIQAMHDLAKQATPDTPPQVDYLIAASVRCIIAEVLHMTDDGISLQRVEIALIAAVNNIMQDQQRSDSGKGQRGPGRKGGE